MAQGKPPPFRLLPPFARVYIAGLFAVAGAALAISLWKAPQPDLDPSLLILVAALCSVANMFEVFAPGHYSFQPNLVFFLWGSLLLPPWAVAFLAALCFVPGWLIHRFRWYMTGFNVANYLVSALAARWVADATNAFAFLEGGGDVNVAGLIAAVATFIVVNHILLLLVVSLAQRRPLHHGFLDRAEGMPLDTALALTGACLAVLWAQSEPLALLVTGPMFLIYRALWLPLLEHKARTDPKTGLYNSGHLVKELADALNAAKRHHSELSVVMLDLDHLRVINNTCGHLAGDRIIRGVAELLSEAAGQRGIAARFGGEEFCLLLPNTSIAAARQLAESLRSRVEAMRLRSDDAHGELMATISAGVANYPTHGDTVNTLLQAADAAVYDAKLGGRNRVRVPLPPDTYQIFETETLHRALPEPSVRKPPVDLDAAAESSESLREDPPTSTEAKKPSGATHPTLRKAWARKEFIAGYAALLSLAALAVAFVAPHEAVERQPLLFVVLVCSALVLDLARLDLFQRAKVSPASVPSIALAMIFGPIGPLVSEGVIAVVRALQRERLVKWAWDFGALSLAGAAAGEAFTFLPADGAGALLLGGTVAGLAYYLVNMSLLSVVMGLNDGRGPFIQWREGLTWLGPHFAAFGAMAGAFVLCEQRLGMYVFPVFGLPIAMLWVAQKQYLDRSRTSVTELRRNAEQLRTLLQDREELLARVHRSYLSTITSLARTIEAKDPYTGGHTERVATIAHALATRLGFDENELRAIEVGSIVHDIGKIGIADGILLKHGPLSQEERGEMRRHTDIASYILAELELPPIVKQMARSHHERYDGQGYPDGLTGEEIPLAARILSVADALDAMTSNRPYRAAMSLDRAWAEIEDKASTQFCPRVVATLQECLDEDVAFRDLFSESTVAA
jgi:diguanylate cyclase (GGDEF)-like protein